MAKERYGPGLTPETRASDEYHALKDAIEAYRTAPDISERDDIWRALGNITAPVLREQFKSAHGLDRPADKACIRRLITGEDECTCSETISWADIEKEKIGKRKEPPHSPPHHDHAELWLDTNGDPAIYSMHVYVGNVMSYLPSKTADPKGNRRNGWFDMVNWARHWGLEIYFSPSSWYYPFAMVNVRFYPPGRY